MASVKIEITLSNGDKSLLIKEIPDESLQTFDQIEDFTTQLKRAMLPEIQSDLLLKSQQSFKKKSF